MHLSPPFGARSGQEAGNAGTDLGYPSQGVMPEIPQRTCGLQGLRIAVEHPLGYLDLPHG